jgi:hypothetical protein
MKPTYFVIGIIIGAILAMAGFARAATSPLLIPAGGTGWGAITAQDVLFGDTALRIGTSSAFTWDGSHLSFTYGSTTGVSATFLCLSTDCRTSWPTSGTFPFTVNSWGNSTTSAIGFLTGGILVNAASSTFAGAADQATTTFNQSVVFQPSGNFSTSESVGGPVRFNLTGSNTGIHVFSSNTSGGVLFDIDQTGVTNTSQALRIEGSASNQSTVNVQGGPTALGVIKVSSSQDQGTSGSLFSGDASTNSNTGMVYFGKGNDVGNLLDLVNSSSVTEFKIDGIGNSTTTGYIEVNGTGTSTFTGPLSTNHLAVTGNAAGCAQFGAGGYLVSTGSNCSSGGISDPFTHAQTGMSATTSAFGVGTTTPFSQFAVSSSTAGNALTSLFAVASNTNATLFNILGNGNVGVGTTSPGTLFGINGSASFTTATSSILGNGLRVPYLQALNLTAASCDVKALTDGSLYCGTDATGSGTYPFTPSTDGGLPTSATSTPIQGTNPGLGLDVSATSWYGIAGKLLAYASSTNHATIFGLSAGGQNATTSATVGETTAVGYTALTGLTTGTNNTAIGSNALFKNSTGGSNTALGYDALSTNTTGSFNVAIGSDAGVCGNGAYSGNTFVGYQANQNCSGLPLFSTALGYEAGFKNVGYDNDFYGELAGQNVTTGNHNLIIGWNALAPSATASDQLNIGNIIFGTGLTATSSSASTLPTLTGNIGLATTTPAFRLTSVDSTNPQIALGDGTIGNSLWTERAINNNFYLATTSPTSWATSTVAALTVDKNGYLGIGTTSPMSALSLAGNIDAWGKQFHYGTTTCGTGGLPGTSNRAGIEYCGFDNSDTGGINLFLDNGTKGVSAWGGLSLNNDLADNTYTHFAGFFYNSSAYTSTFFGTDIGVANMAILQASDGPLALIASTSTAPGYIWFGTGGTNGNERERITVTGNHGIGTTTPQAKLDIANAGASNQIYLEDTGAAANSHLFGIGTSRSLFTVDSLNDAKATTTLVSVNNTATTNLGFGSTTPSASFAFEEQATSGPAFVIGDQGTSTPLFKVTGAGTIFANLTTSASAAQTGYWCYDANGQFIRDSAVCLVSALKFKKDVADLSPDLGLKAVLAMKPVTYYLKQPFGVDDARQQIGLVADWAEAVVPQLVTHDSNGDVHGFNYEQYTAVLTKAIQQQQTEIEALGGGVANEARENWQWAAIILLICWNLWLTVRKRA